MHDGGVDGGLVQIRLAAEDLEQPAVADIGLTETLHTVVARTAEIKIFRDFFWYFGIKLAQDYGRNHKRMILTVCRRGR